MKRRQTRRVFRVHALHAHLQKRYEQLRSLPKTARRSAILSCCRIESLNESEILFFDLP